jgi:hypothetical protein
MLFLQNVPAGPPTSLLVGKFIEWYSRGGLHPHAGGKSRQLPRHASARLQRHWRALRALGDCRCWLEAGLFTNSNPVSRHCLLDTPQQFAHNGPPVLVN